MSAEPVEVVTESQAIILRPSMAVGQAMSVKDILDQVKLIQDVMRSVMKEGEHFGTIPGCGDKKTLLQPGAQKLTMTFRLAPAYEIQEVNLERGHKEYRVTCTLKSMASGSFVGQGVGCCSSMESKYRYRGGARKCPECGKETIIKGKAEYGGGWLCWAKKGGCGAKWEDGTEAIESQSIDKIENENPADTFNTVLKMAKKRAFVDATITATAASDIFTQDIGDDEGDNGNGDEPPKSATSKTKPGANQSPKPSPKVDGPPTDPANHTLFLTKLRDKLANPDAEAEFVRFLRGAKDKTGKIMLMPNEGLPDLQTDVLRIFVNGWAKMIPKLDEWLAANPKPQNVPLKPVEPQGEKNDEKNVPQPHVTAATKQDPEWFLDVIVHVPPKGVKKVDYMKNPNTIGWLHQQSHSDEDARKRLFGFVEGYEPKGWTNEAGKFFPPSEADKTLRVALDAFADWREKHGNDPQQDDLNYGFDEPPFSGLYL